MYASCAPSRTYQGIFWRMPSVAVPYVATTASTGGGKEVLREFHGDHLDRPRVHLRRRVARHGASCSSARAPCEYGVEGPSEAGDGTDRDDGRPRSWPGGRLCKELIRQTEH